MKLEVNPMSTPVEALASEVLRLSPEDRARLLDQLIESLDADRERDAAWDALAASRDAEIESGRSQPIPGKETVAKLRSELA